MDYSWAWETHLVFAIDSIARTNRATGSGTTTFESTGSVLTPVGTSLSVGTITSHVTCVATDTTDDVRGEVALLGAVVFAMSDLAAWTISCMHTQGEENESAITILTRLILVVTKCSIERRQLAQLVPFEFILTFGNRRRLCFG